MSGKSSRPHLSSPTRWLVALFVLALIVRTVGIWWGAPYGDERPQYAARVLTGELVPGDHFYPPLLYYVSALGYAVLFVIGRLLVVWHSTAEFRAMYFEHPELFTTTCRIVVALFAAASAPLGAACARRLDLSWRWALAIGLLIALHPVNVWWSHVAKPQIPMTTGIFGMTLALLVGLDNPRSRTPWIYLGAAIAVAVAFKHTAVFHAFTMVLGLASAHLIIHRISFSELLLRGLILGGTAALVWAPLSIGVLLDLENFLAYQKIQAFMSNRSAGFFEVVSLLLSMFGSVMEGVSWPGLALAVAAPLITRSSKHVVLLAANTTALIVVAYIAGSRITPGLLLPFSGLFLLQGGVLAAWLASREFQRSAWAGRVAFVICLFFVVFGSARVLIQALRKPVAKEIAEVLHRLGRPGQFKVIASKRDLVGVPIAVSARAEERERHERLANKYDIELPPPPPERIDAESPAGAYHVRELPWAMHGLEVFTEEELLGSIRAFAWPIQPEEWSLEYWTDRGYEVFVIGDGTVNREVPAYRPLFEALERQAKVVAYLKSNRKLFFEPDYTIYRAPVGTASVASTP